MKKFIKKIEIDIVMCKLTISPNFSTISRAFGFLFKYLDIYEQSMNNLKFEQFKEQMNDKTPKIFEGISLASIESENKEEKFMTNYIILKSRDKSTITISFSMKGINILLPINPELSKTYIIYMALEMPINYIMESDTETCFKDSKIIKIHYFMKKSQLGMDIKDGNFSIYEYKEDFILLNNKNTLIKGFKMSFILNNNLDNKEKANKNNIKIYLDKETELSMNINQIIIFQNLFQNINEFLKEISKEKVNKKIINEKEEDDEDFKIIKRNSFIKDREMKEEAEKLKRKEIRKIENIHYIDIYTYDITFPNFYIKFYDIVDGTYQSLIEFSMKETNIEFL